MVESRNQSLVRINNDLMGQLRTYSHITGVPVAKCVEEAVDTFIQTAATARLQTMYEAIQKKGSSAPLTKNEKALLPYIKTIGKTTICDLTAKDGK